MDVFVIHALLFEVYIRALDFWGIWGLPKHQGPCLESLYNGGHSLLESI